MRSSVSWSKTISRLEHRNDERALVVRLACLTPMTRYGPSGRSDISACGSAVQPSSVGLRKPRGHAMQSDKYYLQSTDACKASALRRWTTGT